MLLVAVIHIVASILVTKARESKPYCLSGRILSHTHTSLSDQVPDFERPRRFARSGLLGSVRLDFLKPRLIYCDLLDLFSFGVNSKTEFLELLRELLAVHKVDWRSAIARGLLDGVARKSAGRDK